ncbi:unnamed protein product [Amoebophrya sp. A120]|nr:unnamed protein product [Amoebophrya sp. A120]|eukprot:GSA120T00006824001.1
METTLSDSSLALLQPEEIGAAVPRRKEEVEVSRTGQEKDNAALADKMEMAVEGEFEWAVDAECEGDKKPRPQQGSVYQDGGDVGGSPAYRTGRGPRATQRGSHASGTPLPDDLPPPQHVVFQYNMHFHHHTHAEPKTGGQQQNTSLQHYVAGKQTFRSFTAKPEEGSSSGDFSDGVQYQEISWGDRTWGNSSSENEDAHIGKGATSAAQVPPPVPTAAREMTRDGGQAGHLFVPSCTASRAHQQSQGLQALQSLCQSQALELQQKQHKITDLENTIAELRSTVEKVQKESDERLQKSFKSSHESATLRREMAANEKTAQTTADALRRDLATVKQQAKVSERLLKTLTSKLASVEEELREAKVAPSTEKEGGSKGVWRLAQVEQAKKKLETRVKELEAENLQVCEKSEKLAADLHAAEQPQRETTQLALEKRDRAWVGFCNSNGLLPAQLQLSLCYESEKENGLDWEEAIRSWFFAVPTMSAPLFESECKWFFGILEKPADNTPPSIFYPKLSRLIWEGSKRVIRNKRRCHDEGVLRNELIYVQLSCRLRRWLNERKRLVQEDFENSFFEEDIEGKGEIGFGFMTFEQEVKDCGGNPSGDDSKLIWSRRYMWERLLFLIELIRGSSGVFADETRTARRIAERFLDAGIKHAKRCPSLEEEECRQASARADYNAATAHFGMLMTFLKVLYETNKSTAWKHGEMCWKKYITLDDDGHRYSKGPFPFRVLHDHGGPLAFLLYTLKNLHWEPDMEGILKQAPIIGAVENLLSNKGWDLKKPADAELVTLRPLPQRSSKKTKNDSKTTATK